MNILRKLGGVLLALSLATFAAPAIAAKTFDLAATSPVSVNQSISVTFTNRDDGNSSFNSVSITGAPAIGTTLVIGSVTQTGSAKAGTPVISNSGKTITITDLSPIKGGKTLVVTLNVTTTTGACSGGRIDWSGGAWTGSPSTPSNAFSTTSSPFTLISAPACEIKFDTQPKNSLKDQLIRSVAFDSTAPAVKVSVTINGSLAPAGTPVALTSTCAGLQGLGANTTAGVAAFNLLKSTAVGAACTLTATSTSLPSGYSATSTSFDVVEGVLKIAPLADTVVSPVSVTVSLVNPLTNNTIPAPGSVTLIGSCSAGVSPNPGDGTGSVAFSINPLPGTCTIGATGVFAGVNFATIPATSNQKVATVTADGVLGCEGVAGPGNTFNGTPLGGTNPAVPAYFVGYRAADFKHPSTCNAIPYTITNNINGTGSVFDANGFILGPNMTAINYPLLLTEGVLLAHTITFAPVPSGSDGLPSTTKKVHYCKEVVSKDCTDPQNRLNALGCNSPDVDVNSIPGTEPGCIRGASWVIVPASGLAGACPDSLRGSSPVCIQHKVDILEKQDPPWGMTDE